MFTLLLACTTAQDNRQKPSLEDTGLQLPEFVDDCGQFQNESLETASGLWPEDNARIHAQLCDDDLDVYVVAIPPGTWVSLAIEMSGSGKGDTDLDLWEVNAGDIPGPLNLVSEDEGSAFDVVYYSATEQPYERLAWHNLDQDAYLLKYVVVDGWRGATDDYELVFQVSEYDHRMDCDDAYDDTSESGPCNRIQQFPQANTLDEGYVVSHSAHYSNLRREVSYLVRWAADRTAQAFPDTRPLGLMDMSQADGDTPGRMEGSLRHPEGTHVHGNDIDIAYYQTGSDNLGRAVCSNDGYFCTGPANTLDARRTAYFMAQLTQSPNVRVIGVDPVIGEDVMAAAEDLKDEGLLDGGEVWKLKQNTTWGNGWPFHHHHMHFSWEWEDGHSGRSEDWIDPGCMVETALDPSAKQRLGPGLD